MSDEEWLASCAQHAVQADNDRGGAPMGWLARAVEKRKECIAEFGQDAWDAAYAKASLPIEPPPAS